MLAREIKQKVWGEDDFNEHFSVDNDRFFNNDQVQWVKREENMWTNHWVFFELNIKQ